ncbi:MAG: hypothetical protein KAR79_02715 [Simkaniaceae bacterium]|nr:hypothetical protein [Simkaniaceae bacterium]
MSAVTNTESQQNIFFTFVEESLRVILDNKVKAAAIAMITTLGALFISPEFGTCVFLINAIVFIVISEFVIPLRSREEWAAAHEINLIEVARLQELLPAIREAARLRDL